MDSVTQAVLGAVIGRAVICRGGILPLVMGAIAGTLPDFDFLLAPFVSDVSAMVEHRSATHSLLLTPLVAWLLSRLADGWLFSRKEWLRLLLWCFITHILLDLCTVYGTQLLWPLSREPFALSWVFIIDPLYTLPLAAAVAVFLLKRRENVERQRRGAFIVLALTTLYLCLGGAFNRVAHKAFEESALAHGITPTAFSVQNAPLTIFQWKAIAVVDEGDWSGRFSVLSPAVLPQWKFVAKLKKNQAVELAALANPDYGRLKKFSKGLYRLEEYDDGYYLTDLRFGEEGVRPFSFRVAQKKSTGDIVATDKIVGVEQNDRGALALRIREWLAAF